MRIYVKSFSTFRTIKKATANAWELVDDSLDYETSTVTVVGDAINRSDAGNWLIVDGQIFRISNVSPESAQTVLTLESPLDAFTRPIELEAQPGNQTIGGFVSGLLQALWASCDDPVYAIPYLIVSNSDTMPFVPPEVDNGNCFKLSAYCRLMRKTYRTTLRFTLAGDKLSCSIYTAPAVSRQISFEDVRSHLGAVSYSSAGLSKITAIQDIDTGEKNEAGEAIMLRERTTWYLAEDGSVSQLIPDRRASGEWGTVYLKSKDDVAAKVAETFAKNKANHKLEFWSFRDLPVQADCSFMVYGTLLQSYISYKRKSSDDNRIYYKVGELATTASEKLKGVLK